MTFTTTSKYSVLTPYMLMEFMYADSPNPEQYHVNTGNPSVGYNKIVNGYIENDVQIFNPKINIELTNNTTENTVIKIDSNTYVTLDSNLIIPFNDFDDNLTKTINLPIVFQSNLNVVYDTVRFHIRAGYSLSNLDGIINSIKYEDQDGSYVTIASILIKKGTQQIYSLNTSPIKIGSDIYDKYVEIKIPNLLDMQNKYAATVDSNKHLTLASLISKSGRGFNSTSPMRIFIDEVKSITDYNGYPKYGTINKASFSLEQENQFKNIGSIIKPSDSGEFFEFFATDDGGFIEDFILFQNSIGNSYYLYHQISVIEQIGTSFIETSNFSTNQTTAYDVPNLFRPIVRNASVASSFILRYTMSLVNNKDNTSILRISSYTSNTPGKYGTRITPIQISENPIIHKIYNKVYDQPKIQLNQIIEESTTVEVIKYANVFIQQMDVSTSVENLHPNFDISNSISLKSSQKEVHKIYGRGKAIIKISPFDNYLKFTFYTKGNGGIPDLVDISSSGNYKLIFIDNKGNKIGVDSIVSKNVANPAKGELAFLIDENLSERILNFTNENYYISNMPLTKNKLDNNENRENITNKVELGVLSKTKAIDIKMEKELNLNVVRRDIGVEPIRRQKKQIVNFGSSSVLYRGIWKSDINEKEEIKIPIIDVSTRKTESLDEKVRVDKVESEDIVTKKPSVKIIEPEAELVDKSTKKPDNSETPSKKDKGKLSGSNLISAVSALIQTFNTAGWTYRQIYDYFLLPGQVGYITFPGLTKEEFTLAAEGIISPSKNKPLFDEYGNEINPGSGKKPKLI